MFNIYVPYIGATKYVKLVPTELKGEINSTTIILGALIPPLATMDRSSNNTCELGFIEQHYRPNGPNRTFHPTTAEYILLK